MEESSQTTTSIGTTDEQPTAAISPAAPVSAVDLTYQPLPTPEVMTYQLRSGYSVQLEMKVTAGDVLTSTLLAFLIVVVLTIFFHWLILGRRGNG